MEKNDGMRTKAILVGLVVTFIWATSWILTPMIIQEFDPIHYAGVRFLIAGLVLVGVHSFSKKGTPLSEIRREDWRLIFLLGVAQSSFMQFTQYIALLSLDATTLNLVSNLSAILIIVLSVVILKEKPTWLQLAGAVVFVMGVLAYYYPFGKTSVNWWGYVFGFLFILSSSFASILARAMGRRETVKPITYTGFSMVIGGMVSLVLGMLVEGPQTLSLRIWGLVIYMAVVNAALAFVLWNWTFSRLRSFETALISSTMLVEIAFLQWVFFGKTFSGYQMLGMGLVMVAVILVQLKQLNFRKEKKVVE